MISCEVCNKVLGSYQKLYKHCIKWHPKVSTIQCCFCDFLTTEDLLFRKHKSEYHPRERLACEFCEFTSKHWRRIKKHHTRIHFTSNETICNSTQIHNSTGIKGLKSTQPEVKEKFVAITDVKTKPNVKCSQSEEEMNPVKESDKSIVNQRCSCEGLNSCNLCTLDVVNNGHCTQQTSIVCDVCKKMFNSSSHLSCHQVIHTSAQDYICSMCDRYFVCAEMYDVHLLKRHFMHRPYKCELCDKSYGLKCNLTNHMRIHIKELINKCDKCNYQTHVKGNMERHQRYHYNLKPYMCKDCDYAFSQLAHLAKHVRVHTGEKPFCCNLCRKRFAQRINLKVHKKHIHFSN